MTMVSMRMPVDVVEDLKRVAEAKGMPGYQTLLKFYVGQALRRDLDALWREQEEASWREAAKEKLRKSLEKSKVAPAVIEEALASVG